MPIPKLKPLSSLRITGGNWRSSPVTQHPASSKARIRFRGVPDQVLASLGSPIDANEMFCKMSPGALCKTRHPRAGARPNMLDVVRPASHQRHFFFWHKAIFNEPFVAANDVFCHALNARLYLQFLQRRNQGIISQIAGYLRVEVPQQGMGIATLI